MNTPYDTPEEQTHPWFPDQVWPYAILAMVVLVTLGLLALAGRPLLEPGQAADPRSTIITRPEWYFLALFQFAKLGPALITTILVPTLLLLGLIAWPLLDARYGPKIARRLGWRSWPAPKHNRITGALWIAGLSVVALLTVWAAFAPQLCLPWLYNGPVCAG
ncbi:MAG TPA: hypothetical protein VFL27_06465 [Candidatus Dormibacteraeota bacterium]|nr:hypothetical protein [Candidatus Dormibacteraeota bacterium]